MSIIIPSGKATIKTVDSALTCPQPREILVVRGESGLSKARNTGARIAEGSLLVMLDDDLVLSPKIWDWLVCLKRGEFAMCVIGEHVGTRVFCIYSSDFWKVGGFDDSIKYMFEDGEFYLRALDYGLKFKVVPRNLYKHIDHPFRLNNMKTLHKMDWEYSKMLVKFKRHVKRNLIDFFIHPFDYRTIFMHLVVKAIAVNYWIWRGT